MMVQLAVLIPAVAAIYAATGAWVFSCDPNSKNADIVEGSVLYGLAGLSFMIAKVVFQRDGSVFF
jgi:hypothetical protein